jgi:hypothetical protein
LSDIWNYQTGTKRAEVDVPLFCQLEVPKEYFHLAVSYDLEHVVITDEKDLIHEVNLDVYFEKHSSFSANHKQGLLLTLSED